MTIINILSVLSAVISLAAMIMMILLLKSIKENRNTEKPSAASQAATKEDLSLLMGQLSDSVSRQMSFLSQNINGQTAGSQQQMETLRTAVGGEMQLIRRENAENLAEIRRAVDEKLENTLEKRLNESFMQVGSRLEQVYRGLGEMQSLAANVGDLQKLLRNVKIRGTWGEVQLGGILSQMLAPSQYSANVRPNPNSSETVEYCVKIPDTKGGFVWLPLDAKCPLEDYQRLKNAEEKGDVAERNKAAAALYSRIKAEAKDISGKYICPPHTTDFAVLFLPLESLFAEILQQPELCEALQREYRVLVAGPTTLAALLNILQLGYQSAAICAGADEVRQLLGQVKAEFNRFGEALAKSQKKLCEASNSLENMARRTRAMERQLRDIETAPAEQNR